VRARIRHDRFQTMNRFVRPRRIRGHGDNAGIKAAEKRGEKIQARRINQQRTITDGTTFPQRDRDGTRPAVEVGIGQFARHLLARLKKSECGLVAKVGGSHVK
jgi:hypothetical protein